MDPTTLINTIVWTFASSGVSVAAATVSAYLYAYGITPTGAQQTIAVLTDLYNGAGRDTTGFSKLAGDGSACPQLLLSLHNSGGLVKAATDAFSSGQNICDYQTVGPGATNPTGTGNPAVDAILAALPPGVATSLGAMVPAAPIINQIVQTICSNATLCQNSIPVLTAGSQFPDLLEWAYQQGKLIQAVQDSVSSGKPLPDVIAAQQGKPPVTGTEAPASSSMTVPLVIAGLGVAGVLYLLATRKPMRRSYVKVK